MTISDLLFGLRLAKIRSRYHSLWQNNLKGREQSKGSGLFDGGMGGVSLLTAAGTDG
jgi:hypothetical protein